MTASSGSRVIFISINKVLTADTEDWQGRSPETTLKRLGALHSSIQHKKCDPPKKLNYSTLLFRLSDQTQMLQIPKLIFFPVALYSSYAYLPTVVGDKTIANHMRS